MLYASIIINFAESIFTYALRIYAHGGTFFGQVVLNEGKKFLGGKAGFDYRG